jgi:uncharacterized protein YwgA
MFLQFNDIATFQKANEVLYVLFSAKEINIQPPISKLGLQKLLYLATLFSHLRNVIISFLDDFHRDQKGPYSSKVQNIVDHLVAYDLVRVVAFEKKQGKNSYTWYEITEGGENAVKMLIEYQKEKDKYEWIDSIVRVADLFSKDDDLQNEEYMGIDKIVKLVYEDPLFNSVDMDNPINFDSENHELSQVMESVLQHIDSGQLRLDPFNKKADMEFILISFFEYLMTKYTLQK